MEFGIKALMCAKEYAILTQLMQTPEVAQEITSIIMGNISLARMSEILNVSMQRDTYFSYGEFDFPLSGVVEHTSLRITHNPNFPVKILSKNLTLDFSHKNQSLVSINSDTFPNVERVYLLSYNPNVIIDKPLNFMYWDYKTHNGGVVFNHKPQELLVTERVMFNSHFMNDDSIVQSVTQLQVSFHGERG